MPGESLTRYWFRTKEELGFGITAFSEEDAKTLLTDAATTIGKDYEVLEIIPNVDLRALDQNLVLPHMGSPNSRGVWYPRVTLPS